MDSGGRQWSYYIQPGFQCAVIITGAFPLVACLVFNSNVVEARASCVMCHRVYILSIAVKVGFAHPLSPATAPRSHAIIGHATVGYF